MKTWKTSYVLGFCATSLSRSSFHRVVKTISPNLIVKGWSSWINYNYLFRMLCFPHIKLLHIIVFEIVIYQAFIHEVVICSYCSSMRWSIMIGCIHHVVYYEHVQPWKLYSHVQSFKMYPEMAAITLGWHLLWVVVDHLRANQNVETCAPFCYV